ncbi:MAG: tyrosine recombinase XerC [Clostridia bacterium]|nr:tyrosine recombinase XerC [Clostridia bacterium]
MGNFDLAPEVLNSFLIYIESIQGKSKNTAEEYFYDLRTFFRYLKIRFKLVSSDTEFDKIDILDVDLELIKKVDLNLVYEYMNFLNRERNNSTSSRARKIASLRSYFKYITVKKNWLEENPIAELESIKIKKSNPKNLTVDDSLALLSVIDGKNSVRDFCIITLFLNCGLRLSELVSINIIDVRNDTLVITGKGNKERTVYLNDACMNAIANYMEIRKNIKTEAFDADALFLSSRNKRISRRMVQQIVENNITKLGLDPRKYTTHKLRHTAATLMYQSGVDIRALQEILGHEHLSTTEIYTHVDNEQIREAAEKSPLSWVKQEQK